MSSTEDYIPVKKPNWLEFARNYHSIAARPGYKAPREYNLQGSVKNGAEQKLRPADHGTPGNSPEDYTPSGYPVRGIGVGSDQGMRSQTGGGSSSPTGYSWEEQYELAFLDWMADATSS